MLREACSSSRLESQTHQKRNGCTIASHNISHRIFSCTVIPLTTQYSIMVVPGVEGRWLCTTKMNGFPSAARMVCTEKTDQIQKLDFDWLHSIVTTSHTVLSNESSPSAPPQLLSRSRESLTS
mmetsp:Transcript_10432/g.38753  ORF Transcript_10432/g.38753 Transcript_10432/m.38753 type:complete len:123 (+) Transcript_10432:6344-6712(+)